jgi:hypothetical protein
MDTLDKIKWISRHQEINPRLSEIHEFIPIQSDLWYDIFCVEQNELCLYPYIAYHALCYLEETDEETNEETKKRIYELFDRIYLDICNGYWGFFYK